MKHEIGIEQPPMAVDPDERLQALGLMYNVRGTVHPLNGDYYGPNTLGVLGEVVRTVPE